MRVFYIFSTRYDYSARIPCS